MSKPVRVPALRTFTHQDRVYHRGDVVSLPPVDAAILARQGYVSLSSSTYRTRQLVAEPAIKAPVKPRRRYRRRQLVAEAAE